MPYTKQSISFGLVYIPVDLHACGRSKDIGFKMIDKNTHQKVHYRKFAGDTEVEQRDIVKGFEYDSGRFVEIDDKEIEKLKTKKEKNITIERFVKLSDIDPIYFERAYYIIPTGAEKAYSLLVKAMTDEDKVGIATGVLGTKERLMAVRAMNGQLVLYTLWYADELQNISAAPKVTKDLPEKELELARLVIQSMSGEFVPEMYKDDFREKLQAAIDAKIAGEDYVVPADSGPTKVLNLMDALLQSLKPMETKKEPRAKTASEKKKRA